VTALVAARFSSPTSGVRIQALVLLNSEPERASDLRLVRLIFTDACPNAQGIDEADLLRQPDTFAIATAMSRRTTCTTPNRLLPADRCSSLRRFARRIVLLAVTRSSSTSPRAVVWRRTS